MDDHFLAGSSQEAVAADGTTTLKCMACGTETEVRLTEDEKRPGCSYLFECGNPRADRTLCPNLLAVSDGRRLLTPSEALSVCANEQAPKDIGGRLGHTDVCTMGEGVAFNVLQRLAFHEIDNFMSSRYPFESYVDYRRAGGKPHSRHTDFHAALLSLDAEYIGYLLWTVDTEPDVKRLVLRQIYLRRGYRQKGHGTSWLRFWYRNTAEPYEPHVGVEAPNSSVCRIIGRLGLRDIWVLPASI